MLKQSGLLVAGTLLFIANCLSQVVPLHIEHEGVITIKSIDSGKVHAYHYPQQDSITSKKTEQHSTHGYAHTPKGNLHMLIIFALFREGVNQYDVERWPVSGLPDYAKNGELILSDTKNITPLKEDLTSWFYQMSYGTFSITADIYPVFIKPQQTAGGYDFWQMYKQVFDSLKTQYPNIDLSKYDNRKNNPMWAFDNVDPKNSGGDGVIDYTVINFRLFDGPIWTGYSSHSLFSGFQVTDQANKTYQIGAGHTAHFMSPDLPHHLDYFKHEFAHVLFDAPHYMGANNLPGKRFYTNKGWGIMGETHKAINTTNAWESWWLGWMKPQEISKDGVYQLKDFITEKDALRIPIPGTDHVLWLENHQMKHALDNKLFYKTESVMGKGIYAFITSRGNSREKPYEFGAMHQLNTNSIKVLHAKGNSDFIHNDSAGNRIFYRKRNNIISGQHELTLIRVDFNNDKQIPVNTHWNNEVGFRNEHDGVLWENGKLTYAWSGHEEMAFGVGDEISRSGVTTVTTYPIYNENNQLLSPYFISPLSIEIVQYDSTTGHFTVHVHFNDVELRYAKEWYGRTLIKNVNAKHQADLVIFPGVTLTIGTSQTPTKHKIDTLTQLFSEPGNLTLDSNTITEVMNQGVIHLNPKATVRLNHHTVLRFKPGSRIQFDEGATLKMEPNAKLILENGRVQFIAKAGSIDIIKAGVRYRTIKGNTIKKTDLTLK